MCHVVSMLVYCNCMTTVLCWSLVCCMSSCNGGHMIELTVYRVSTKERKRNKVLNFHRSGLRENFISISCRKLNAFLFVAFFCTCTHMV